MVLYKEYWSSGNAVRVRRHILPFSHDFQRVGFFDGAGGCGFIIYLTEDHFFRGWMGLDISTNNFSELMTVWLLLHWAHKQDLRDIRIFRERQYFR